MGQPEVAVVIPTFNRLASLRRCLDRLRLVSSPTFSIIVVDDGSSDGTAECLSHSYPEVTLLLGDGNLWWAGAMNVGCRSAAATGATWVLVLNDDSEIEPDTIAALVATSRQYPDAIVGPKVLVRDLPNTIWSAGGAVRWPWPGVLMRGYYEPDHGQYDIRADVAWLPGMGTLIRTEHFKLLGFYDAEHLPQLWGDADLTLRARKLGLKVLYEPRSRLWNDTATTGMSARAASTRDFWLTLVHPRSRLRVRSTAWFYAHHCPARWLPIAYGMLYGRHAAGWAYRSFEARARRLPS